MVLPSRSNAMVRVLVVPWSMERMYMWAGKVVPTKLGEKQVFAVFAE
jgi:hypothetical protein